MNTPVTEHPSVKAHQQLPTPQKASEPADAVEADEVSFVKKHRWLLLATFVVLCAAANALPLGLLD